MLRRSMFYVSLSPLSFFVSSPYGPPDRYLSIPVLTLSLISPISILFPLLPVIFDRINLFLLFLHYFFYKFAFFKFSLVSIQTILLHFSCSKLCNSTSARTCCCRGCLALRRHLHRRFLRSGLQLRSRPTFHLQFAVSPWPKGRFGVM
jgi:hypothetical protein